MSLGKIDAKAILGFDWAKNGGSSIPTGIETDMDLMAFNAGVSNANISLGLNVPRYIPVQSKTSRYHDKPNPRSNLSMQLGCE